MISLSIVDTLSWDEVDRQFSKLLDMEEDESKRTVVQSIPLGRIEQPEHVADAVTFLASKFDYIPQRTPNIDGGNWPS